MFLFSKELIYLFIATVYKSIYYSHMMILIDTIALYMLKQCTEHSSFSDIDA